MINAGLEIKSFVGTQRPDSSTETWKGIAVIVHYPPGENPTDNPASAGDMVIEPNGNVWEVVDAVQDGTSNGFSLEMRLANGDFDPNVSPSFGTVKRGGIVTPTNGFVAPYWNSLYVSSDIGRIAAMFTMQGAHRYWSNEMSGVDLGTIDNS